MINYSKQEYVWKGECKDYYVLVNMFLIVIHVAETKLNSNLEFEIMYNKRT